MVLKLYDTDPYFSKIRTYRDVPRSRNVTCTLGDRIRICSDSDFFRSMENQISGHVIDTQRTKVMILFILPDLPKIPTYHIRVMHVVRLTHLTRYDPLLNRICTSRHSIGRFSQTKSHDTTRIPREIPWYVKFHCEYSTVHRASRVNFHGTLSFIVNFHTRNSTTNRVSRVKLHDTLR